MATFEENIIGEITGLKAALQSIAGRLAVLSEFGNDDLKQMHSGAHALLATHTVTAPNTNGEEIRGRAEATIDMIFGTLNVTLPRSNTPPKP